MVPHELSLKNFMCYRGQQPPLRFGGFRTVCLSGDNGAGKSALLDAITWALWGKARLNDSDVLITQGESEMAVELTFWLNQDLYRVTRRRQRAGSDGRRSGISSLDFHVRSGEGWKILGAATVKETQELIKSVLRMNYNTFINASFFVQGRADEFTRKTPSERKQVLAEILGLHDYERVEKRAKERSSEIKGRIQELSNTITMLEPESKKQLLYRQRVAEGETLVGELTNHLRTAQQEKHAIDELVRGYEQIPERRQAIAKRIAQLHTDIARQEWERSAILDEIREAEQLIVRQDEITRGLAELEQARASLNHLDTLFPHYNALQSQWRAYQEMIKDMARELKSQHEGLIRDIARCDERLAQRPHLEARIAGLTAKLPAIEQVRGELDKVRQQREELNERRSRGFRLLRTYQDLTNVLDQQQQALIARKEEYQRLIQRLEKQLADVAKWTAELHAAQEQRNLTRTLSQELADLRDHEQTLVRQVEEYRAHRTRFEEQIRDIQKRLELLRTGEATTCPLCRSHLGEDGLTTIARTYEQEIVVLRNRHREVSHLVGQGMEELRRVRQHIGALEQRRDQAQKHAARLESLQQQLEQANRWAEELQQAYDELATVETTLTTASYGQEIRQQRQAVEADLHALGARTHHHSGQVRWSLDHLEEAYAALGRKQYELETQLAEQGVIEAELEVCRHQLEELDKIAAMVPDLRRQAETLAVALAHDDFAHDIRRSLREVEDAIATLGYTPEAHQQARTAVTQLAHWQEEAHRFTMARATVERGKREVQRIDEVIARYQADVHSLRTEDDQLAKQFATAQAVQERASFWAEQVRVYQERLNAAEEELREHRVRLSLADEAAKELERVRKTHRALTEKQSMLDELAKALGKDGVQAMLIETAVPEIEEEANRLLGQMTGNQMHVALELQKSTKEGKLQETLHITISDALGTRDYETFSGGEAMRINFAIRIALSRLLARRAGASLETLIIDEGFGALDAEGRERFVEAIAGIQNDFKCILVISHIEDLKDKFPVQIHVTKHARGSSWEVLA